MKNLLKEEGLTRAARWYVWNKTFENFTVTILMSFFIGSIVWFWKQISMIGW